MKLKTILFIGVFSINSLSFSQTKLDPYFSEECGDVKSELSPNNKIGKGGEAAKVFFENFHILLKEESENFSKDCYAKVKVQIPPNKRLRFHSVSAEGSANLSEGSNAGVELDFSLDLVKDSGEASSFLKSSGDFFTEAFPENSKYTECSSKEQILTVELNLRAYLKHRGKESSILELDEANQKGNFVCNWQWKSCEIPHFQKKIVSYYKMGTGRAYRADVKINGETGTFKSGKGYKGKLFDIVYENENTVINGRWSADGKSGDFKWKLIDEETGKFRGSWTDDECPDEKGSWWGENQENDRADYDFGDDDDNDEV